VAPVNRYRWYERLEELAHEARGEGAYELANVLHIVARLVLVSREETVGRVLEYLEARG
jgi:hypothetical protein